MNLFRLVFGAYEHVPPVYGRPGRATFPAYRQVVTIDLIAADYVINFAPSNPPAFR